ncbi:MAG: potassium channel family protein [Lachnospiraceae bacterium]|jgi:voltage-gated potassium channel
MKNNKKAHKKTLRTVLKRTHFFEVLGVYLLVFMAFAFVIFRHEDVFPTYGSALWYCFELVTTIGFGELVAVTRLGRLLSILLSVYSIGMIAIITSTVVTYHQTKLKMQENDALILFMDKLERLPELDEEELRKISEKIKELRS